MTSAFPWQNSITLCPALFCTPRPNLPVTPGISWLPTSAFQSPVMKRTSVFCVSSRRSCRSSKNQSALASLASEGSLVAQMVKNLPAVQKTWVWYLGGEDPLEKGMATHSSVLAWRLPGQRTWWATVYGVANSQTWLSNFHFTSLQSIRLLYGSEKWI